MADIVKRDVILDAAVALMAERGARGTSIAAVAERSGLTDAGVLYHFKTKQALLLAVVERFETEAARQSASVAPGGIALLRSLRDLGAWMAAFPEMQSLLVVLSAEHLHDDGPAGEYFRTRYDGLHRRYRKAFRIAAADGDLAADLDADAEATAVIAFLDGIRLQWFLRPGRVSMAGAVRTYVDQTLERLAP